MHMHSCTPVTQSCTHTNTQQHNNYSSHTHTVGTHTHFFFWIIQASASCLPPPQKLKPHVIIQHHCTSFPLYLHPAIPLCLELLTHGWLNQQFRFRGIHLDCGSCCGLLVIYLFTGTNPCSYSQYTLTLVITRWATFHWKNKHFDTIAQFAEQNGVKKWMNTLCKNKFFKSSVFKARGFRACRCIMKTSLAWIWAWPSFLCKKKKRTAGNLFGCRPLVACQNTGVPKTFHLSASCPDLQFMHSHLSC